MEDFVEEQSGLEQSALLLEISQGDEGAFKQLVDTYSDRLGLFIAAITKDHQVAQEIVQDVFLKIWETKETLVLVKNFQSWLFVVSKNQALNALRRAITLQMLPDEQLADSDLKEELLEKERRFCLLDEAIADLPEQQKKVFLLSRREGKSYKQIGALLNLSPQTVKKYIQLAVAHIIKYVENVATLTFFYFFIK